MAGLYICHTLYHILIASERALVERNSGSEKSSIAIVDSVSDIEECANRVKGSGLFSRVYTIYHEETFSSWTNTSFYKSLLYLAMNKGCCRNLDFIQEYSEVYIFNDHRDIGAYLFYSHIPYHLLEDGKDCFAMFNQFNLPTANNPIIRKILKRFANVPIGMSDSPYCMDVEINSSSHLATPIAKPIIVSPKDELESKLKDEDREIIAEIFPVQDIGCTSGPRLLILTSPPEAHGRNWSESMQLDYYEGIAEQYCDWDIVLKPHPRDESSYGSCRCRWKVIPRSFPIEVLNLIPGPDFDLAIAYASTALSSLKKCKTTIALKEQN